MAGPIKILHTGDIHLDSPFSRLDARRSEIRRSELRASFTSMLTYARVNEIDIILIAGDLFDSDFVTRETVGLIVREFEKCRAQIFIVSGNHDCITPSSVYAKEGIFPANVHVFPSDKLEKMSLDDLGVDIYGYSYMSSVMNTCPIEGKCVDDEEKLNILLCHADITSKSSSDSPITEGMIRSFGADYTALGHLHNAPEIKDVDGCCYAYSGCLEGRDFGECGVKGAIVIEATKEMGIASLKINRVRFSKRRYEKEDLYVDGAETLGEISEKIGEFIDTRGYGDETLLSLTLRGAVAPSLVINTEALEKNFPELFKTEIIDETVPAEDLEGLADDITVKGQFYRELALLLESGTELEKKLAEHALRYGLSALAGENIIDY